MSDEKTVDEKVEAATTTSEGKEEVEEKADTEAEESTDEKSE